MLHTLFKSLGPAVAMVAGAALAGCSGAAVTIGGEEGVPLNELDLGGEAPHKLVLAGPDTVVVNNGDTLDIDVSGEQEAVDALRFSLEDGTLGIARESDSWNDKGRATIRVTMPPPSEIVLAGSGGIAAQSLQRDAEVTITGSGRVDVAHIDADRLDVNVLGSGTFAGSGSATRLDLNIAGSGEAQLDELQTDRADVNIAGSGSGAFASDGRVEANILGSGDVTVWGRAKCEVNALGSGKLTCKPSTTDHGEDENGASGNFGE